MKYEVILPDEIDQRLMEKASEIGTDAEDLIRIAVGRFVEGESCESINGHWSEEGESRRRFLIDMDIAGTITAAEQAELSQLDQLANEHFDRVAPPPIEGARRLHEQLMKNRGNGH